MIAYPDCSFLCAIYRFQSHSLRAISYQAARTLPLPLSTLLLYEFRQSVRFQNFLFSRDRTKGYAQREGLAMLASLEADLRSGAMEIVSLDWAAVHATAERLSATHTTAKGLRTLDILHVATALHLGAREFLTFDERQAALAEAEGLRVRP